MSNSFEIPWTAAHQAPLSMGFSRQEYWNRLPFPSPIYILYDTFPSAYDFSVSWLQASQVALHQVVVKNLPAKAGDGRDAGSIPGLGRSPGGGHGNPLQCSCLENPMDRGAWQTTVHGVAKGWTQLSIHTHTHTRNNNYSIVVRFAKLLSHCLIYNTVLYINSIV